MSLEPQRHGVDRLGLLLFVGAIFASAFLLFLVQPMVGKRILPWFGGAPSVWTLCLAFYQTALFTGYAYAYLLIRFTGSSQQLILHALVFLGAGLVLPVLPLDAWRPDAQTEPTGAILAILFAHVALPFLTLAATGPLVQVWFARRHPTRSPYPLYAVSNLGSLLALLSYPFLIEPRLPLSLTGNLWSIAFVLTGAAVLGCAAMAWRTAASAETDDSSGSEGPSATWQPMQVALWLLLSGCAVVLLMGLTNKLCLDLASVPFLWILPLGVYLLSFIVCFGSERAYRRTPYVVLTAVAFFLCYGEPLWGSIAPETFRKWMTAAPQMITFHCALLFAACMVLHGELYRLRPPVQSLTAFYLCVSAGGALGGIFVGVVALHIFDWHTELPLGLALWWLLLLASSRHDAVGWLHPGVPLSRWAVVGVLTLVSFGYAGQRMFATGERVIHKERSFFGVLQVIDGREFEPRMLYNGVTLHGAQFQSPEVRRAPTSYFGVATGIGVALQPLQPPVPRRIGVVGLGVGTLASYGRTGDYFRFYEIDPAVIRLATNPAFFSFLGDTEASVEVVAGDARLALVEEQTGGKTQDFDVLIVDAFSSDAIPVHLLTRESFEIYADALAEGGLLALHVSNKFFDLRPVVARAGRSVGLESLYIRNRMAPKRFSRSSTWVFLSRDRVRLQRLEARVEPRRKSLGLKPEVIMLRYFDDAAIATAPLWTDDYSDLFGALLVRSNSP